MPLNQDSIDPALVKILSDHEHKLDLGDSHIVGNVAYEIKQLESKHAPAVKKMTREIADCINRFKSRDKTGISPAELAKQFFEDLERVKVDPALAKLKVLLIEKFYWGCEPDVLGYDKRGRNTPYELFYDALLPLIRSLNRVSALEPARIASPFFDPSEGGVHDATPVSRLLPTTEAIISATASLIKNIPAHLSVTQHPIQPDKTWGVTIADRKTGASASIACYQNKTLTMDNLDPKNVAMVDMYLKSVKAMAVLKGITEPVTIMIGDLAPDLAVGLAKRATANGIKVTPPITKINDEIYNIGDKTHIITQYSGSHRLGFGEPTHIEELSHSHSYRR